MEGSKSNIVFRPQPGKQEQFLSSGADIVIYGGAAGGGKTFGALLEAARHIDNKNFRALIFRRISTQIDSPGGLWDESQKIYPFLGGEPIKSPYHKWKFPSGAEISMRHMQYEKDMLSYQGSQIPLIIFDELTHFTKDQFFYMLSRNRSTCGVKPYMRATTNPDADSWVADLIEWWIDQETGYAIEERSGVVRWFYRVNDEMFWYDSKEEAIEDHQDIYNSGDEIKVLPKSLTFISSFVFDNPALLQSNPEYLANLNALGKVERERLLKGNWKVRPAGGLYFNRAWWKFVDAGPKKVKIRVRYWDKAGTEDGGCFTAGVLLSIDCDGLVWIEDIVKGQWSALNREKVIRQTAEQDGKSVYVYIEQEPGSGGKESAENTIRMLSGFKVYADKVSGDKVSRAEPLSAQVEAGNVNIVKGSWNKDFVDNAQNFPDGEKDEVDAASGGYNKAIEKVGKIKQSSTIVTEEF